MQHEPIVVTGAGCVSALGHSVAAFWSAPQDGRCGLSKLKQAAPSDLKVSIVALRLILATHVHLRFPTGSG